MRDHQPLLQLLRHHLRARRAVAVAVRLRLRLGLGRHQNLPPLKAHAASVTTLAPGVVGVVLDHLTSKLSG